MKVVAYVSRDTTDCGMEKVIQQAWKHQRHIDEVYDDSCSSRSSRKELQRLLKEAWDEQLIKHLYVPNISSLGQSSKEALNVIEEIVGLGITVYLVEEQKKIVLKTKNNCNLIMN